MAMENSVYDERNRLAADRTVLASERTYAAWTQLGLAALAAGIGAGALLAQRVPTWMIDATGSLLVLFSAFCFCAAVWRQLRPGPPPPPPHLNQIHPSILVTVNGFLCLVAVATAIGLLIGLNPKL